MTEIAGSTSLNGWEAAKIWKFLKLLTELGHDEDQLDDAQWMSPRLPIKRIPQA